jgi:HEAT repeat protein
VILNKASVISSLLLILLCLAPFGDCKSARAQTEEKVNVAAILADIQNPDKAVRDAAHAKLSARSVKEAAALVPDFIRASKSDQVAVRNGAQSALSTLSRVLARDETAIEEGINLLALPGRDTARYDVDSTEIRQFAMHVLEGFKAKSVEPLIKFIERKQAESYESRAWAALTLEEINIFTNEQLEMLNKILSDKEEANAHEQRFWIAVALANNRFKSGDIYRPLVTWVNSDYLSYQRWKAAEAIEKMGKFDEYDLRGLFKALYTEQETYIRAMSAYKYRQSLITSRVPDQEVTYSDTKLDLKASDDLVYSAMIRASLVRTLAVYCNNQGEQTLMRLAPFKGLTTNRGRQDELADIAMQMLTTPEFTARYPYLSRTIDFAGNDDYYDSEGRMSILPAFKQLGVHAVAPLLKLYQSNPAIKLRLKVIQAIGEVGEPARDALPLLIEDIDKANESKTLEELDRWNLRRAVITAMGGVGASDPKTSIPKLITLHHSRALSLDVPAAKALETIAKHLAEADATDYVGLLRDAEKELATNDREEVKENLKSVKLAIKTLNNVWRQEKIFRPLLTWGKYLLPFMIFPLLLILTLLLYWLRPVYLFKINEKLAKLPVDYKMPGAFSAPLRYMLIVGFFHYSNRVLDALLKEHVDNIRTRFSTKNTVKERSQYVPIPVMLDGQRTTHLTPALLKPLFKQPTTSLLVVGEGGTGKTSLACLMAKWALSEDEQSRFCKHMMLPVLIEPDSEFIAEGNVNVVERAIQMYVRTFMQSTELPSPELVHHLLKSKRLLLLIDGLSEIDEPTRKKILMDLSNLPVTALVITSRQHEYLEEYSPSVIEPMKISGSFLSDFLSTYFAEQKVRREFEDEEFFDICRRMSLLSNNREVTALLVRLYADLIVAAKLKITKDDMPQNLPDLVLHYLNYLNREFDDGETCNEHIHESAKIVAWECLKKSFHPAQAETGQVMAELGEKTRASKLLDHLEKRLDLVRRVGMSRERIRFSLEPLAEYLAGMRIAESSGTDEEKWKELISSLKGVKRQNGNGLGFINALQDCCLTKYAEAVPKFVPRDTAKLTGMKLEDKRRKSVERRVEQIVRDLQLLGAEDLVRIKQEISLHEQKSVV